MEVSDGRVANVRGDHDDPVSKGYVCSKGRSLGRDHTHTARLNHCEIGRPANRRTVSPSEALDDLSSRLADVLAEHGPDAVATLTGIGIAFDNVSGPVLHRLIRRLGSCGVYTTWTVDNIAKPVTYQKMGGAPLLWQMIDTEHATLSILIGTNLVISHGHDFAFPDPVRRLRAMSKQGEVWVLDPRSTETAKLADRHLPVRAGEDYAVLAYLIRELLRAGADRDYLRDHVRNVELLAQAVEPFELTAAAQRSGLEERDLLDLLAAVRRAGTIGLLTGTGATMSRLPAVTV